MTDRQRLSGLPQIALHQLPRPIHSALERAPDEKPRPDLANVIVEDRLAARIAKLDRQLAQPLRRNPRIGLQLLTDPLPERVELRRRRWPLIARRPVAPQRPADRATVKPRPTADLPNREPLDRYIRLTSAHCSTPATHSSSPDQLDRVRVKTRPDAPSPTPGGSLFNRRRWVSIQPAPTAAACRFSPPAGGPPGHDDFHEDPGTRRVGASRDLTSPSGQRAPEGEVARSRPRRRRCSTLDKSVPAGPGFRGEDPYVAMIRAATTIRR